jgi:NAD(P)-dependent dehydrogenase (short-subunit alcohol dehydrogenase family)
MNPEDALAGHVALVTGGSKGIGLAIVRRLGRISEVHLRPTQKP